MRKKRGRNIPQRHCFDSTLARAIYRVVQKLVYSHWGTKISTSLLSDCETFVSRPARLASKSLFLASPRCLRAASDNEEDFEDFGVEPIGVREEDDLGLSPEETKTMLTFKAIDTRKKFIIKVQNENAFGSTENLCERISMKLATLKCSSFKPCITHYINFIFSCFLTTIHN